MKVVRPQNSHPAKLFMLSSCIFIAAGFSVLQLKAQQHSWVVDSAINVIDGWGPVYNKVQPGDTVYLKAGNRDKL